MSSPALEAFLARLYTDEAALATFLAAPHQAALGFGLDRTTAEALALINPDDLVVAARSFRATRARRLEASSHSSRVAQWRSLVKSAFRLLWD